MAVAFMGYKEEKLGRCIFGIVSKLLGCFDCKYYKIRCRIIGMHFYFQKYVKNADWEDHHAE